MKRLLLILFAALTMSGAGRELAPRDLGPTAYDTREPRIAYAGGKFLTVWVEYRLQFGWAILGALSDASGTPLGPSFVVDREYPLLFDLVSTGDGFVLFHSSTGVRIEMRELDLSGRPAGPWRSLPITHTGTHIEWNGTHFLAVTPGNSVTGPAEGVLFTRTGDVVRRRIVLPAGLEEIVPDRDGFVVVTANREGLFANRVTAAGISNSVMIEEGHGFVLDAYRPFEALGASRGDGSILAVWTGGDWRGYKLKSTVIAADGSAGAIHELTTSTEPLKPVLAMHEGGRSVVAFTRRQSTELGETVYALTAMKLSETGALTGASGGDIIGNTPVTFATGPGVAGIAYDKQQIFHRVVDLDATVSPERILSITRARQLQPIIGAGGRQFLAAFNEEGGETRTRGASIAADGEPLSHRLVGTSEMMSNELAWSGTEYLTVLQRNEKLFAQRLAFDGETIGEPILLAEVDWYTDAPASVVWSVDRWVVAWLTDRHGIFLASVSPAGLVSAPQNISPTPEITNRALTEISLAADGPRVLVSWIEGEWMEFVHIGQRAYAQRFRRDGRAIDAAPMLIPGRAEHIASTFGHDFLVITDATATLFASNEPSLRAIASRQVPSTLNDVTWDGREYAVTSRNERDLIVSRLDAMLNEARPPRGIRTLPADLPAKPSVAAVMSGEVVVAVQEGDFVDGARAVVYRERDMTELPLAIPRRRAVR